MPDHVRKLVTLTPRLPQEYRNKAWSHLVAHEGVAPRIYSDPKGIPTLGAGYALAVKGGDGTYRLRNWDEIGAKISGDPQHPYAFSAAEKQRLEDVVGVLNGHMPPLDLGQYHHDDVYRKKYDQDKEAISRLPAARAALAQEIIPPGTTDEPNYFGFKLPKSRSRELTEEVWPEYRGRVLNQVRTAAAARGWSREETEDYIAKHFLGSDLELALTSLLYNGVSSPAAIGAMLDGDLARLREEILYRSNPLSNGDSQEGISKRRRAEADLATGDPSTWTPEQQKAWKAIEANPERREYRERFPEATTSKRQIGTRGFSPEAMRMLGLAAAPLADAGQTILLKSPAVWTEDEVRTVMNGGDYWGEAGQLRRTRAQDKVGAWFRSTYDEGPQRLDRTGRPIRPTPIRSVPTVPTGNTTADGGDLYHAAEEVAATVAQLGESKGLNWAVQMLQTGMNLFGGVPVPLATDGVYGPKTDLALKQLLAENGLPGAETAFQKATVLDLVNGAIQSGTLNTLLQMLAALFGYDLPDDEGSSASKAGGGSPVAQLEHLIRRNGAEGFVRSLSPGQAGAVHVRAYSRSQGGQSVQVSAYDRAAPSTAL